jgi:heat-inducible transcriptional repressor
MPIAELPPGERRFVAALVRTASAVMSAESKRIADGLARLTHQLALAVSMESGTPRVAYSGARHILEQPEFDSAERLAPLFGLLDERTTLGRLLASLPRPNRVRAWIGRELPIEGMRSFALVAMKTAGHSAWGVGVLGPMRMDYPAIVARLALFGELSDRRNSI